MSLAPVTSSYVAKSCAYSNGKKMLIFDMGIDTINSIQASTALMIDKVGQSVGKVQRCRVISQLLRTRLRHLMA